MQDQRIYYVPPRFLGLIDKWSGRADPAQKSWLVDHAASMNFNAIWFSPFFETTAVEKYIHGQKMTGSYYAIRDNFKLDPDYSSGCEDSDREHLRHFCAQAAQKNIRVYTDLVCNHVAADHPLVLDETREIMFALKKSCGPIEPLYSQDQNLIGMRYNDPQGSQHTLYFKFKRRNDLSLEIPGPANDPWSDVAPINYSSPEAMRFFITGDQQTPGYFKQVIDWHLDLGFKGFRCDAAYLIPPAAWQELIQHAHNRQNDVLFMAETLGGPSHQVSGLANARITDMHGKDRAAFDYGMLGIFWWNFQDTGLPLCENPMIQSMSHFGGAGSPDTHDTDTTLATALRRIFNRPNGRDTDEKLADAALRDYAVSVLACNSSYMQMGFEFLNEKQNHVFRGQVSEADWQRLKQHENTALDIRGRIKAIHDLKEQLNVGNCRASFKECGALQNGAILKLHIEYTDVDTHEKKADVVLLLNRQPENGPVFVTDPAIRAMAQSGMQQTSGLGGAHTIRDVTIFHTPVVPPGQTVRPSAPQRGPSRRRYG